MSSPLGKALFHVFKMAERDIEDSPVGVSSPTVFIIGAKLLRPHDLGLLDVERSAPSSTPPPPLHPAPQRSVSLDCQRINN